MNLLAIETATDMCSVALAVEQTIHVEEQLAPQQHAQIILPMIESVLLKASLTVKQLDGVVFGQGPGSFTGVRIAAAVTQGIAFGASVPVCGVSTLQAMAQQAIETSTHQHVLVSLDARMKEVYWCAYARDNAGIAQPIIEEQVCAVDQIKLPAAMQTDTWLCLGSGVDQYAQSFDTVLKNLKTELLNDQVPSAAPMLSIARATFETGHALSADKALPVYLRNKVALTEQERARGDRL